MKIVQAGTNPVQLTRGIEKTVSALVKELKNLSTEVKDEDLINVATVSAGGSEVVSHLQCLWSSQCANEPEPLQSVLKPAMAAFSGVARLPRQ